MTIESKAVLDEIDSVLGELDGLKCRYWNGPRQQGGHGDWTTEDCAVAVTLCHAAIMRIAPRSSHGKRAEQVLASYDAKDRGTSTYSQVAELEGALRALRLDVEAGRLSGIVQLLHAELFADFLEMAAHLLDEGYKDPAAVLAGSVLEEHLRKLAEVAGIDVLKDNGRSKKADALNAELAGADVYNKLDQKSVTAWLDLRNNAAHGKYDEYDATQVGTMLMGVRDFLVRNPA